MRELEKNLDLSSQANDKNLSTQTAYSLILDEEAFQVLLKQLITSKLWAFDTENNELRRHASLTGRSIFCHSM